MPELDIRWKQRFSNFEKAYLTLQGALAITHPSKVEEAGLIQIFEFTFELGWKTLKDLLESDGFSPKSPRDTIKFAFSSEYISNGQGWLDALEKRNLMAHTYDEATAKIAVGLIKNHYALLLEELYRFLKGKV